MSTGLSQEIFSTTLSSIPSATKRFNLALSSSNCFRRLASDRSIAPYLAYSLQNVSGPSPCLPHSSEVGKPASCSLIFPIVCASVKRLFLMSSAPSGWADSPSDRGTTGGQVSDRLGNLHGPGQIHRVQDTPASGWSFARVHRHRPAAEGIAYGRLAAQIQKQGLWTA